MTDSAQHRSGSDHRRGASARSAIKRLRNIAGRVYYTFSRELDSKPEELIEAALGDARRRGRKPICIAASFPLHLADIEGLASEPTVNAIVGKNGLDELQLWQRSAPRAALGTYWESGRWALPPGVIHIYLIGSWRRITLAMLRETIRRQAVSLTVRCARGWIDVPLDLVRRIAGFRGRLAQTWRRLPIQRLTSIHGYMRLRRLLAGTSSVGVASSADTVTQPLPDPGTPNAALLIRAAPPLTAAMVQGLITAAQREQPSEWVSRRVVLVCGSLQPGGAERQVAYTAAGLTGRPGVESVTLICDQLTPNHPERYDFYLPLLQQAGVPVHVTHRYAVMPSMIGEPDSLILAQASFPEGLLLDVANIYREFRRLRPEVVHAWLDWSNTRAGLAAALAGVPRIVLSGRNLSPTNFSNIYQSYMDPVYQALCNLPNVVMLNNSQAGADSYAEWLGFPTERISVIYNAFNADAAPGYDDRDAMRARLGIPADALVIGGVFRLYPEKRPLLWIEVARHVSRFHPKAWFVMVGQGILKQEIEQAARRFGIADRLLLPGVVNNVLPVMRAFDLFLLTSFGEGLPNVVLEAQSAGLPVVATRAGGVVEAMEPGITGWVVDPPDPMRLAERVTWLLSSPDVMARARAEGPALIRSRFGMRRMIDETLRVYGLGLEGGADPAPAARLYREDDEMSGVQTGVCRRDALR
jgi:glycosyltransferase involved in cell wall biosynthesis